MTKSLVFTKKCSVLLPFVAILAGEAFSGAAQAATPTSADLSAIRTRLEQCLVRPYGHTASGQEVLGDYRSVCSEVVRDGKSAFFSIHSAQPGTNAWEVQLLGSQYADGGDISDVALWNDRYQLVLEAQRVIAFGDPLEALAQLSGAKPAQKVYDSALDQTR